MRSHAHPFELTALLLDPCYEWIRVALLAPLLMFPVRPVATFVAVGAWLVLTVASRAAGHPLMPRTPLAWPLALVGLMAVVGTVVSPFPDATLPKAAGLLLGFLALRATLFAVRTPADAWTAALLYLVFGLLLLVPGLFATAWLDKYPIITAITRRIPHWITGLTGTDGGVQPNALGAHILLLLPLAVAMSLAGTGAPSAAGVALDRTWAARVRLGCGALALVLAGALVLTQSRGAWLAAVLTCQVLLIAAIGLRTRGRRVIAAVVACAMIVSLAGVFVAQRRALARGTEAIDAASSGEQMSVAGRIEVWGRAVLAIRDHPLTGVGLGAFRRLSPVAYPLMIVRPGFDVAHCHNVFLQTALDIGVPGLVGYLGLLTVAAIQIGRLRRSAARGTRALALGLGANLVAVHCFGLTDAVALGAKIGLFVWLNLGVIAALSAALAREEISPPADHAPRT